MLLDGRRLIGYRAVDKKAANDFKRPQQEENTHANYGQPLKNQQFLTPQPMPAQHTSS